MSIERPPVVARGPEVPVSGGGDGSRPRRRAATRERVLDAARDEFAERGVFGGTVEDICARAGFTRGAFYSNFADKNELLRALIAREHDRLLAHLDANIEGPEWTAAVGGDPRATMAAIADRLLHSVPADRQLSLVFDELEIHAVRDPAIARLFSEADARFRARIAVFVERGLARLGRELVVDIADATDAVLAIVEQSIRRSLLSRGEREPYALARVMLPLVMAAASRPGAQDDAGAR